MLVTIDTSSDTAGLALIGDNDFIAEYTWSCGQNHSVQLLPNLAALLEQAKLNIAAASGIIVARGPGGYNGLRVGLSTAKTLAFCLDIPLAGISTLEAIAFPHTASGMPVCSIITTGSSEIAAAIFEMKSGVWSRSMTEQLLSLNDLCSKINRKTLFCGQITATVSDALKSKLGEKAVIVSPSAGCINVRALAELGRRRIVNKDYDDITTLQPLYLRGPSITPAKHK